MCSTVPAIQSVDKFRIRVADCGFRITQALREYIERRGRSALARYAVSIMEVNVTISSASGQHNSEWSCRTIVWLKRMPFAAVSAFHENVYAATALAIKRAEVVVDRMLGPTQWPQHAARRRDWIRTIAELNQFKTDLPDRRRLALCRTLTKAG